MACKWSCRSQNQEGSHLLDALRTHLILVQVSLVWLVVAVILGLSDSLDGLLIATGISVLACANALLASCCQAFSRIGQAWLRLWLVFVTICMAGLSAMLATLGEETDAMGLVLMLHIASWKLVPLVFGLNGYALASFMLASIGLDAVMLLARENHSVQIDHSFLMVCSIFILVLSVGVALHHRREITALHNRLNAVQWEKDAAVMAICESLDAVMWMGPDGSLLQLDPRLELLLGGDRAGIMLTDFLLETDGLAMRDLTFRRLCGLAASDAAMSTTLCQDMKIQTSGGKVLPIVLYAARGIHPLQPSLYLNTKCAAENAQPVFIGVRITDSAGTPQVAAANSLLSHVSKHSKQSRTRSKKSNGVSRNGNGQRLRTLTHNSQHQQHPQQHPQSSPVFNDEPDFISFTKKFRSDMTGGSTHHEIAPASDDDIRRAATTPTVLGRIPSLWEKVHGKHGILRQSGAPSLRSDMLAMSVGERISAEGSPKLSAKASAVSQRSGRRVGTTQSNGTNGFSGSGTTDHAPSYIDEGALGLQLGASAWNAVGGFGIGVGEYHQRREVGRGAQAVVFEVEDADGQTRAMKVIDLQGAVRNFARKVKYVDREVRILKRLSWAASVVVPLYECWIAPDFSTATIVMEFLPLSLATLLKERRNKMDEEPFDVDIVAKITVQMLAGLAAIHEAGAVHRDVKPENILVKSISSSQAHCKLADFGVGRMVHDDDDDDEDSQGGSMGYRSSQDTMSVERVGSTAAMVALGQTTITERISLTMAVGTLGYASPELLGSGYYSSSVDIYALGSVLLELQSFRNAWGIYDEVGGEDKNDDGSYITPMYRALNAAHCAQKYFGLADDVCQSRATVASLQELCISMMLPEANDRPSAVGALCQTMLNPQRRQLLADFPELLRITRRAI